MDHFENRTSPKKRPIIRSPKTKSPSKSPCQKRTRRLLFKQCQGQAYIATSTIIQCFDNKMGSAYTKVENRYQKQLKIILTHPSGRNSLFHLDKYESRIIKSEKGIVTVSVFETDKATEPDSALTVGAVTGLKMQPGHLTSYEENSFPGQLKKELKEQLGNTVKNAVLGLRNETEKGAKEIATVFTELVKNMENATIDLKNVLDSQPAIGPQADTFYRLIEKAELTFQTIIENISLKVTGGKVVDFNSVDTTQQKSILLELGKYLGKGIKISTHVFKALKWSFRCIVAIFVLKSIYKIYNSDNPRKEATKIIIDTGVGLVLGSIGAKLGALVGAFGGPIGIVVCSIIGGMIGGVIGKYCSKGIYKIVCMIFFPKYTGGPGQPPIKGTKHIYGQPCIPGAGALKKQAKVCGLLPKGQPKITGAAGALGLPKLW